MNKVLCIVDAYSTGAELAPLFRKEGWRCIHVQTNATVPADYLPSYCPDTFDAVLMLKQDDTSPMQALAQVLRAWQPEVIIPGTETGVELADFLCSELDTEGNAWQSSALRRDKYKMQEALRAAKLPAIRQLATDSLADACAWVQQSGCWPVVVKPMDSAGADSVRFCHNFEQLTNAFNNIYGKQNKLGLMNHQVTG